MPCDSSLVWNWNKTGKAESYTYSIINPRYLNKGLKQFFGGVNTTFEICSRCIIESVLVLKQLRIEGNHKELNRWSKYARNDIFFLINASSVVSRYCLEASLTSQYVVTSSRYPNLSGQSIVGYQWRNYLCHEAVAKDNLGMLNIFNNDIYRILLSNVGAFRNNTPFITGYAPLRHLKSFGYRIFNVLYRHFQTDYPNTIPNCIQQCEHWFLNLLVQGFRYIKIEGVVNSLRRLSTFMVILIDWLVLPLSLFAVRDFRTARIFHLNVVVCPFRRFFLVQCCMAKNFSKSSPKFFIVRFNQQLQWR